jgi:hypothetical protein
MRVVHAKEYAKLPGIGTLVLLMYPLEQPILWKIKRLRLPFGSVMLSKEMQERYLHERGRLSRLAIVER